MATIRCSVDICHYWGEGQYCTANEIWVRNDMEVDATGQSKGQFDMEIGTLSKNTKTAKEAQVSTETCCETFKPKGKMS